MGSTINAFIFLTSRLKKHRLVLLYDYMEGCFVVPYEIWSPGNLVRLYASVP